MSKVVEIALFTDHVEATKGFYAHLVSAPPEAEWPGGTIFGAGGAKLLVHERSATMEDGPPNEDHFAIGVPDLEAACQQLRAQGHVFLVEPRDYPWGRSAYLRDPDGRLVELSET
ncbi:MAG TPA: VOC family protein [Gaiellaceae bacterium]|nr:VOC family protein [Gaiellaceae bacterium]